eukprot:TRINITY_DN7576_c0_g1_i1.p2 TRINITY_DN7576_c0_g1~~TRINITY_DN7576_c0_g1_i1.p2  ORF type:complete len:108 (-),score=20.71 TRINITY_DN7576_c0_g1_i1:465-788(-)
MYSLQCRICKGDGMVGQSVFFFFKQKTAYEMLRSLVGSEMCIRDRSGTDSRGYCEWADVQQQAVPRDGIVHRPLVCSRLDEPRLVGRGDRERKLVHEGAVPHDGQTP